MRYHRLLNVFIVSLIVGVSGCAIPPNQAEADAKSKAPELATLMGQAATTEKTGTKASAISLYEEAAKLYPSSKMPWIRIAQIQYESLNYGEAIVAAQQAVARDGKDKVAQSILSVSGLRVSSKALADLSRQNEVDGSVKLEAQNLARLIRESLGERVLVPTNPTESARTTPSPARTPPAKAGAAGPPKAAEAPEKRSGNPFDVLK